MNGLNIYVCPASNYQQPAKPLRRAGSINAKIYSADARLELHSDDDEDDANRVNQVSCVSKYQKLVHRTHRRPFAQQPARLEGATKMEVELDQVGPFAFFFDNSFVVNMVIGSGGAACAGRGVCGGPAARSSGWLPFWLSEQCELKKNYSK